ncbi:TonB-dependent receptor [Sphingomonas sp. LY29]|uniref:TonB-dependent receptor n=1 Tax=Sphingomonas sp. LY29 TaxID=3095341 RepID=UPI002D77C397|nr:TonB-dependent receptor [Sphingomonas sp. LY29]WRP26991.1 TonB-dependent receptor [Sphingomonas sp. LY29]
MVDVAVAVQPTEQIVIVTGRGLQSNDSPAARGTLDRRDLDRAASGRIDDVLRNVAGLAAFRRSDSRSAHPTSQGLTLRGLGGNAASRVSLLLDGVPQADPFGGWIAVAALDPHGLDQIRFRRGGGIDALAGSLDIDSRTPDATDIDLSLSAGSRASLDGRLFTGTRWSSGFVSLSASGSRTDGFVPIVSADRGAADQRAPTSQASGRVRLVQSIGSKVEAQANLARYADTRTRGTDFSDNRQRGTDASLRLVGSGPSRWSALAYVQDRTFDSQFAAVAAGRGSASLTLDQRVPATGWGARAEIAPAFGNITTRIGAEWRRVSGETDEAFRFMASAPTRLREAGGRNDVAGLFGGLGWRGGGWTLGVEARADRWRMADGRLTETDLAGTFLLDDRFADRSGWQGSGRLSAGKELGGDIAFRAAITRGWRLPTLNELYRPFRAGTDATAANPELDPETSRGVEAGIDYTPRGARLSATLFANRLRGAIANVSLGSGPGNFPGVGFVAAGGAYRQRQNIDAIRSRGLEIDGDWQRGPWRVTGSYAFTDARMRSDGVAAALDGRRPAQVAKHSASASLGWESGRTAFATTARFVGRQFEDDNNDRSLPAALTFDGLARVGLSRRLSVEARVENLLDRQVLATVGGDGTRERAQPRTLWVGLRLR